MSASNLKSQNPDKGDMMDHRRARDRVWAVFVLAMVVLVGGRAFANPLAPPLLAVVNGPVSLVAILICLFIEYRFLLLIECFTRTKSIFAVLLMNTASAMPGFFLSLATNQKVYVHFARWFVKSHPDELILSLDPFEQAYGALLAALLSFPLMLALDVVIEGGVLKFFFKMPWNKTNLLILTKANTITLGIMYTIMVANEVYLNWLFV